MDECATTKKAPEGAFNLGSGCVTRGSASFGHATHDALALRLLRLFRVHRLLGAHGGIQSVLLLEILLAALLFLLNRFLALRNDELATIHSRRLIETVREAECSGLLILHDSVRRKRMMATAVLRMGAGMTHSY